MFLTNLAILNNFRSSDSYPDFEFLVSFSTITTVIHNEKRPME